MDATAHELGITATAQVDSSAYGFAGSKSASPSFTAYLINLIKDTQVPLLASS